VYARVKQVESNPLYRGMASSADVALVELEAPVTFNNYILPVCVPDPSVIFETGTNCWVTGWGSPSEQGRLWWPPGVSRGPVVAAGWGDQLGRGLCSPEPPRRLHPGHFPPQLDPSDHSQAAVPAGQVRWPEP
ncbi:serine protease 27 isoform 2, partial [Daubentonia madagascariensis]